MRYYDPSAGRWLTRDPIGYAGGINLYGYTKNNPVMRIDPMGTDWLALHAEPRNIGGANTGGHIEIYVTTNDNPNSGVWWGYYPSDNNDNTPGIGPGSVHRNDKPTCSGVVAWYHISHDQAATIQRAILNGFNGNVQSYNLLTHNCSDWTANVLRHAFPNIPDQLSTVNTPSSLYDYMKENNNPDHFSSPCPSLKSEHRKSSS